jgi:hypothetical protein
LFAATSVFSFAHKSLAHNIVNIPRNPLKSTTYLFTQASGRYGERGRDEADFNGAFAKYVVITAAVDNRNFGHSHSSLADVQFNVIPESATILLLGFGAVMPGRKGIAS